MVYAERNDLMSSEDVSANIEEMRDDVVEDVTRNQLLCKSRRVIVLLDIVGVDCVMLEKGEDVIED